MCVLRALAIQFHALSGALAWIPTCVPLGRPWGEPRTSHDKPVLHSLLGSILLTFNVVGSLGFPCVPRHDP